MTKRAIVLTVIVGISAVMLSAQTREADGSITRELVNEVRALRAAVERYGEGQIQTQTITGLMEIQQRLLNDLNTRLDALRRDLDVAAQKTNELTQQLASVEQSQANPSMTTAASAEKRREMEAYRTHLRDQTDTHTAHIHRLNARETDLLNQIAAEQVKWNELVGRLDQFIRR
jgi:chromosome segregation ATPase